MGVGIVHPVLGVFPECPMCLLAHMYVVSSHINASSLPSLRRHPAAAAAAAGGVLRTRAALHAAFHADVNFCRRIISDDYARVCGVGHNIGGVARLKLNGQWLLQFCESPVAQQCMVCFLC